MYIVPHTRRSSPEFLTFFASLYDSLKDLFMHSPLNILPLRFPWQTLDPFLFCVHHLDRYPKGNAHMGPDSSLNGRSIGADFSGRDGWSMYHGDRIPGFPQHPHRGFETITIARQGWIDHSDSLGAAARFGGGDVQWMTAGKGVVHSEMFPLIHQDKENPTELFQIWLNLPARSKKVDAHFTMFWNTDIPSLNHKDAHGRTTHIRVIAGSLDDATAPTPPPNSWAHDPMSRVAIWSIRMEPGAHWTLPATDAGPRRALYIFAGSAATMGTTEVPLQHRAEVNPTHAIEIVAGPLGSELLMLQGKPIGEPVVQHGPFVMNTRAEISQTIQEYQRTLFGGWPWRSNAPVHSRDKGRFAIHADGRREEGPK